MPHVQNNFAVDKPAVEIADINHPPHRNYNPHDPKNEFPKLLYHHASGRVLTVPGEKEQKAALRRGFDLRPSPNHDYSKLNRAGLAAAHAAKSEAETQAGELAELGEAEE